jgi:hypothetical protein
MRVINCLFGYLCLVYINETLFTAICIGGMVSEGVCSHASRNAARAVTVRTSLSPSSHHRRCLNSQTLGVFPHTHAPAQTE